MSYKKQFAITENPEIINSYKTLLYIFLPVKLSYNNLFYFFFLQIGGYFVNKSYFKEFVGLVFLRVSVLV